MSAQFSRQQQRSAPAGPSSTTQTQTQTQTQSQTRTQTQTQTQTHAHAQTPQSSSSHAASPPRTLRLRGEHPPRGRSVQWSEDVVDNEGLGRKSSKEL
ncbi:hypothetical protein E4U10_008071 [Claviceps purpurea]|nr:hypothetical protein E4U10_008071 [Claviceps purpurea]